MSGRLHRAGCQLEFASVQGAFTAVARPASAHSGSTLRMIAPLSHSACTSRSSTTVRLIASSRPVPTFARRLNSRLSENQVSFSLSGRVTHDAQKGFFKLFNANGKYFKPSAFRGMGDASRRESGKRDNFLVTTRFRRKRIHSAFRTTFRRIARKAEQTSILSTYFSLYSTH